MCGEGYCSLSFHVCIVCPSVHLSVCPFNTSNLASLPIMILVVRVVVVEEFVKLIQVLYAMMMGATSRSTPPTVNANNALQQLRDYLLYK